MEVATPNRYSPFRYSPFALSALEMRHRVDRLGALADLEMQLRRGHVAALARLRDRLAALHLLAVLDGDLAVMGVGRDVAVVVPDEDELAVALHVRAGVGDGAVLGGLDRRALGQGDVDALVPARAAETVDDPALRRPAEADRRGGSGRRRLRGDAAGLRDLGLRHLGLGLRGLLLDRLGRLRRGLLPGLLLRLRFCRVLLRLGRLCGQLLRLGLRGLLLRLGRLRLAFRALDELRLRLRRLRGGGTRRSGRTDAVDRNDDPLAGRDLRRVLEVVRRQDRGRRHIVAARQRVEALAGLDRNGGTALRRPAAGTGGDRGRRRRHRLRGGGGRGRAIVGRSGGGLRHRGRWRQGPALDGTAVVTADAAGHRRLA